MSDGAVAPRKKSSSQKSFHFVAGLLSGLSTSILLQPADLLKTRIQQESRKSATPLLSALRTIAASPAPIRQLWRGTLPSAVRTGVGSALYFGGLDWLRGAMAKSSIGLIKSPASSASAPKHPSSMPGIEDKSRLSNTSNLLTGAFARAAAGVAMMPVTVLKVRYESSLYNYPSLWAATRDVWAKNGWRGFFSGFGATAVRDAPYAGLYVLFYEAGKRRLKALSSTPAREAGRAGESSVTINFVSGVFAAGLATALTNPFDAIKTRLQLMPERYGNMVRAGRMMLKEEGWRCLFDGLGLRMGRKGMSSALAWTVYEELVRRAEVRWLRESEEGLL